MTERTTKQRHPRWQRERKRSAAQQRKEGGSDRTIEREKEIECYKVLWRSREVSAGTATVRRGIMGAGLMDK